MDSEKETKRRRTFAIISHPDAGKTTRTEKFPLYGGAVHLAGSVAARKNQRATTSDWMDLEKKRGISVSSTVLQFEYRGYCVNLLDTPGHKDFSQDPYRVLTAVDAAVMVIDAGKGIESQTRKLVDELAMLEGAGAEFVHAQVIAGDLTPVFFGSAVERTALRSQLKKMVGNTDLHALYENFFVWLDRPDLFHHRKNTPYEYADVFPLIYLKLLLEGVPPRHQVKHLVIDEMQDYTPVQYRVLARLFPCRKTILGDAHQSVNPLSASSAETIREVLPGSECLYITGVTARRSRSWNWPKPFSGIPIWFRWNGTVSGRRWWPVTTPKASAHQRAGRTAPGP